MRQLKCLLVTGGLGFIGSAFIRYVLSNSDFQGKIINIDCMGHGSNVSNLQQVENDARYQFYKLDICNRSLVEQVCIDHRIDTIVHFAAESHVDRSIHGPASFVRTNILGTFELLEIVRAHPHLHFHHISTDEVYGSLGEEGFFTENSPYQPNSPYSASKAASDNLVRAWAHTYGLSTTMSHCSNNYGPYQHPEKLIPHMIQCCLNGSNLPIYGSGNNVRDWIHVDDHVRAIWNILTKSPSGRCYNIGGRSERTNLQLVQFIAREMARQLHVPSDTFERRIQFVTDRKGHDFRYAIDPSLLENELDFHLQYDFEKGLRQTIEWYLQHQNWLLAHPRIGVQTQSS